MPAAFIKKHGAVVVENHLNMIRPLKTGPLVSTAALAALLNTDVVDQLFRCINGSVAVSAYELEALPLPAPKQVAELESLVARGGGRTEIEKAARRMYSKGGGQWPCPH